MGKERTKFDESKDVESGSWKYGDLMVKVSAYDGKPPKLQIGPRTYQDEESGEDRFKKCGRLSAKEVNWLMKTVMPEAFELLGVDVAANEPDGDNIPF